MTERPRLLFLCQTLPYPPDGGVWIRTYHVLRILSRDYDITALCFERTDEPAGRGVADKQNSLGALRRFGEVEVFSVPQAHSRLRFAWNHLRSLLSGRVYTRFLYESRAFHARLAEVLRSQRFDLVHVDSLDLVAYLDLCSGLPIVCVHHNVESALLGRRADIEGGVLVRRYLHHQASLYREEERMWSQRVDLNVMASAEDGEILSGIAPGATLTVIPNGVDVDEFRPEEGAEQGITYLGGMNWFPNLDALEYFCHEILPHLRAAGVDLPIRWVGTASAEHQRHYRSRFGVELTGYVEDVRPYVRDSLCTIVPLRAGGGTRLKILNAWAMGKAVVSTSIGCEGLQAVDGENILIRDAPESFAQAVVELAEDASRRRRLGKSGRNTAELLYSWEVIGVGMLETYRAVTQRSGLQRSES